jgi:hypothetical protein
MCSRPFRALGFAHLCRSRPRDSVHTLLTSSLYLPCLARRSLGEGGALIPNRSIVSRLRPQRSPATSRLYRPCRSSHSLHLRDGNDRWRRFRGSCLGLVGNQLAQEWNQHDERNTAARLPDVRPQRPRSEPEISTCARGKFEAAGRNLSYGYIVCRGSSEFCDRGSRIVR